MHLALLSIFGIDAMVVFAFLFGFLYRGTLPDARLKLDGARRRVKELRKATWERRHARQECARCMAEVRHRGLMEGLKKDVEKALEEPPVPEHLKLTYKQFQEMLHPEEKQAFASTGCELTDQIFAAAREKGIMPVDVIGPAPNYDD